MTRLVGWGSVLLVTLFTALASADPEAWLERVDPTKDPVPQWIWTDEKPAPNQTRHFRVVFDPKLPDKFMAENPSTATLWAAGDDEMTVHLNGKQVARNNRDAGHNAVAADVRAALIPGRNVLTVTCRNTGGPAGVVLKLSVRGTYREPFFLVSDGSWKSTDQTPPKGWRNLNFREGDRFAAAKVLGPYGMAPWGQLSTSVPSTQATGTDQLTLLPGFKAELLYSVPKGSQGSWVAMASDAKGRIYTSDQSGPLYRVTPGKDAESTIVEPVDINMGAAQGLLWAYDSLYVVINGRFHDQTSALYRLTDTNNDDKLDKVEKLLDFKGRNGSEPAGGEHGPHAVLLGPDKKLYVVAGNFTNLPENLAKTSPAQHWAEDLLLPREPDGRGHDPHIFAPGGWVCRMNPDGTNVEAVGTGMRNTYDIAFNPDGELFGFDSDMEWDVGAPWYRPTRIFHIVSGSEWGWRNGSGKWPTYYPDSLPPVVDIGLGSPTGVTFGTGAKFPAKYQHCLFANDWAYGKIFAVHVKPQGSSYTATYEPFVVGKPFDVTDLIIHTDGHMYVMIGGRNTQSGFYRISYTGTEPTAPAPYPVDEAAAQARKLRHSLEAFHGKQDPTAVAAVWPHLGSSDRFLRYAARMALEFQPVAEWQAKALKPDSTTPPVATIQALLALSRVGDKSLQPQILQALDRLDPKSLSRDEQLELCRVYGVNFIRMGRPDADTLARQARRGEAFFPTGDRDLDHELAQLLVYAQSDQVVAKAMPLMAAADTQEEQMFWALVLRSAEKGWTPPLRDQYFSWLNMAETKYTGGASFKQFLQNIRTNAAKTLTPEERPALAELLKGPRPAPQPSLANVQPARKVIKRYTMADLTPRLAEVESGRNFASGKAAFEAVSCAKCHRFGPDNGTGALGPDITGVGNRFSASDILESIILPNKTISDQYRDMAFTTKSGTTYVGQIQSEDATKIVIRPNPLLPGNETVQKKDITKRGYAKTSWMPEGLIDVLTEDEVLDLLAYLRSAGNPNDKAFKKAD